MRVYRGKYSGPGGQEIKVSDAFTGHYIETLRHRIIRHSPDGFSWGYAGSGPSDLALNLLLDIACRYLKEKGREFTDRHYMDFKKEFIANQKDDFVVAEMDVLLWIDKWKGEDFE